MEIEVDLEEPLLTSARELTGIHDVSALITEGLHILIKKSAEQRSLFSLNPPSEPEA